MSQILKFLPSYQMSSTIRISWFIHIICITWLAQQLTMCCSQLQQQPHFVGNMANVSRTKDENIRFKIPTHIDDNGGSSGGGNNNNILNVNNTNDKINLQLKDATAINVDSTNYNQTLSTTNTTLRIPPLKTLANFKEITKKKSKNLEQNNDIMVNLSSSSSSSSWNISNNMAETISEQPINITKPTTTATLQHYKNKNSNFDTTTTTATFGTVANTSTDIINPPETTLNENNITTTNTTSSTTSTDSAIILNNILPVLYKRNITEDKEKFTTNSTMALNNSININNVANVDLAPAKTLPKVDQAEQQDKPNFIMNNNLINKVAAVATHWPQEIKKGLIEKENKINSYQEFENKEKPKLIENAKENLTKIVPTSTNNVTNSLQKPKEIEYTAGSNNETKLIKVKLSNDKSKKKIPQQALNSNSKKNKNHDVHNIIEHYKNKENNNSTKYFQKSLKLQKNSENNKIKSGDLTSTNISKQPSQNNITVLGNMMKSLFQNELILEEKITKLMQQEKALENNLNQKMSIDKQFNNSRAKNIQHDIVQDTKQAKQPALGNLIKSDNFREIAGHKKINNKYPRTLKDELKSKSSLQLLETVNNNKFNRKKRLNPEQNNHGNATAPTIPLNPTTIKTAQEKSPANTRTSFENTINSSSVAIGHVVTMAMAKAQPIMFTNKSKSMNESVELEIAKVRKLIPSAKEQQQQPELLLNSIRPPNEYVANEDVHSTTDDEFEKQKLLEFLTTITPSLASESIIPILTTTHDPNNMYGVEYKNTLSTSQTNISASTFITTSPTSSEQDVVKARLTTISTKTLAPTYSTLMQLVSTSSVAPIPVNLSSLYTTFTTTSTSTTTTTTTTSTPSWPVKHASVMEGNVILGGLMMVHSREDTITCGPIMPQGGIQALEAMLYTLDQVNKQQLLPNITLGAHILDDCDKDTYGLEMAVDFIKGKSLFFLI